MQIQAKIIADSTYLGKRITTMQLTYPRYIHAQLLTHRLFARNARSSRAIPTRKLIQEVADNPVIPSRWPKNTRGMSPSEQIQQLHQLPAQATWRRAADSAVQHARELADLGVAKEIVNRILEPFLLTNVVVTATDSYVGTDGQLMRPWDHFFKLRCAEDAQHDIQVLALLMRDMYHGSTPENTTMHMPYITSGERFGSQYPETDLMRISAMRCARVSYNPPDAIEPDPDRDLKRIAELIEAGHHSPLEHPAEATGDSQWGVMSGWRSLRYML